MKRNILIVLFFPMILTSQSLSVEMQDLFNLKQYQKAEILANEFLKKNPDNLEAIELLGDTYGFQKKWDEAIVAYKKLVEAKPEVADYHYKYGGVIGMKALSISKFKAAGLIGDLKSSFLKAAELDPNHIEARWALVELYMQLPGIIGGSKKKSLKFANELQNLSEVDGYLAKGYIYEYDDDFELAEENYKKAVLVGGSKTCFQKLINLYENNNKPHLAIALVNEAIQKFDDILLSYQYAKLSAQHNIQVERGILHINKCLESKTISDKVPIEWVFLRKAQLLRLKNDKDQALIFINKALDTNSNFNEAKTEKRLILDL